MRIGAVAVAALIGACSRAPADATPEGALDGFLQACEDAPHDPAAAARAYALLAPASRRALELRAQRATAVTGRPVAPEQMLVPGFTPLRFEISKTTTTIAPDGARATVDVFGPDPAAQHAKVPLEREGGSWRVVVPIP
ncbi:MAG: hypothetical protein HYV09_04800 [Deltaproteobacteria bacterium]|nr:hypothetical protein [Deltaproteobacteria bacterium]